MPVTWQFARATLYEQEQILRAGFSLSPNIPDHYVAHVSTTQPNENGTGVTEYSGNGYAPVVIPAWDIAGPDFPEVADPALPMNQQLVEVNFATPAANIVFPDPTAAWWANGTTVYPYLTDQAGTARWWWSAAPPTAPYPGHPLQFNRLNGSEPATAIGCGIQSLNNTQVFSILARKVVRGALNRLTKADPTYAMPSLYAAIGNRSSAPSEPGDPGLVNWTNHFRFRTSAGTAPGDPDYPDGSVLPDSPFQSVGSGMVQDSSYVRKAAAFTYGGLDADGRPYVSNNASVSWSIGSNTETAHVSGDALPSIFGSDRQLSWHKYFPFDPTAGYPNSTYFVLLGVSSAGVGGPPPDGFPELGGDIWAYLFPDTYDQIVARDRRWVFWPYAPYELVGDDEVSRTNSSPPDYSANGYLFDLQTDGNWHNSTWGSISPGALAVAEARIYYYPSFGFAVNVFGVAGQSEEDGGGPAGPHLDDYYATGDTIGIDAGAVTFRIR